MSCEDHGRTGIAPSFEVRGNSGKGAIMHGISAASCFAAELCSGSGAYSVKLRESGLNVLPVDHQFNKHKQQIRTVSLDLSKDSGWIILYDMSLINI